MSTKYDIFSIIGKIYVFGAIIPATIVGSYDLCSILYGEYRRNKAISKLIQWSPNGDDFIGTVEFSDYHKHCRGKFQSPSGNMIVEVRDESLFIMKKNRGSFYVKKLYPDGNTKQFHECENGGELITNQYFDDFGREYYLDKDLSAKIKQPSGTCN